MVKFDFIEFLESKNVSIEDIRNSDILQNIIMSEYDIEHLYFPGDYWYEEYNNSY